MLPQDNGKNLSTKEAIVVSQDCPKLLGSPVTCGSQRVNLVFLTILFYHVSSFFFLIINLYFLIASVMAQIFNPVVKLEYQLKN